MILDSLLQVSVAQAVTTAAYSTFSVDLDSPTVKRQVGTGQRLSAIVVVTTAAAGDSASFTDTFDFLLVQSASADLSSHDTLLTVRPAAAALVAGYMFEVPVPFGKPTKQYLGLRYAPGTGDTITVSAWFVRTDMVPAWLAYAKGYAI
jgi:hypothetical protein